MTTLVGEQLYNDSIIEQNIRIFKSMYVKVIRLHLYKNGNLSDGNLTLSIFDGATLISSKTLTYSEINEVDGTYWHGNISFEFDDAVFLSINPKEAYKEYTLKIVITDHTDSESIYLCVCKDYEKYISNTITEFKYEPLYGSGTSDGITVDYSDSNPIGIEIYTLE